MSKRAELPVACSGYNNYLHTTATSNGMLHGNVDKNSSQMQIRFVYKAFIDYVRCSGTWYFQNDKLPQLSICIRRVISYYNLIINLLRRLPCELSTSGSRYSTRNDLSIFIQHLVIIYVCIVCGGKLFLVFNRKIVWQRMQSIHTNGDLPETCTLSTMQLHKTHAAWWWFAYESIIESKFIVVWIGWAGIHIRCTWWRTWVEGLSANAFGLFRALIMRIHCIFDCILSASFPIFSGKLRRTWRSSPFVDLFLFAERMKYCTWVHRM